MGIRIDFRHLLQRIQVSAIICFVKLDLHSLVDEKSGRRAGVDLFRASMKTKDFLDEYKFFFRGI